MGLIKYKKYVKKYQHINAQGFPVQIVMMTILGLVLLSMGFFLTSTIFDSGNEFSADLTNQLRTNIDSRYCDGQNSLCAPPIVLRGRDADVAHVNAVNLEQDVRTYRLHINSHSESRNQINASCGILLFDAYSLDVQIESSTTAQIPIAFSKGNVNSRPCTFTTTMRLLESGNEVPNSRRPLVVRIE